MTGVRKLDNMKGEYSYDFANDILLFKIKDRNYRESLEFGNIVIDVDDQEFITGIQIMDASRVMRIPKLTLRNIQRFQFHAEAEGSQITVQVNFTSKVRNKETVHAGQNFARDAPHAISQPPITAASA